MVRQGGRKMASPFEFSYVFTVIGKIWEAMPVTLLLTFAPLFIGFLFGVPFAVIRRFNVPFAASFLKNASNILKGIPAVLLVLMINYLILKPIDYLALSYEWAKPLQTMNKIYIGIVKFSNQAYPAQDFSYGIFSKRIGNNFLRHR